MSFQEVYLSGLTISDDICDVTEQQIELTIQSFSIIIAFLPGHYEDILPLIRSACRFCAP